MPNDDLIVSGEADEILGVDRSTLLRFVRAGVISPARQLPGRTGAYLFRRADVEALRDARAERTGAVA